MAEIRISNEYWTEINKQDKQKITNILMESGLIKEGDTVVGELPNPEGGADDVEFAQDTITESWRCDIRRVGCDTSFVAATTACAKFSGPAFGACMVVAASARESCRKC